MSRLVAPVMHAATSHSTVAKHAREPVQAAHPANAEVGSYLGWLHVEGHEPGGARFSKRGMQCRILSMSVAVAMCMP